MSDTTSPTFRLAIVGSCQVVGLRESALALIPGAKVDIWHVGVHPVISDHDLAAHLANYDLVITQIASHETHRELTSEFLRKSGISAIYLPTVVFNGFHPDLTYVHGPSGIIPGIGADYHSIIVACAFSLGLEENQARTLFNSFTYRKLGYMENYLASKEAMMRIFNANGYDLTYLFKRWIDEVGSFMYTINHPHIIVLLDLCRAALNKAGISVSEFSNYASVDDALFRHTVFPVYPEIANHIGISGSTVILHRVEQKGLDTRREMSLQDYVTSSYSNYRKLPAGALQAGSSHVAAGNERLGTLFPT